MTGKTKRWLIGCGIGCGGLIVAGIVAAIAFGAWISRTGPPLEPERLLGADTTGYVEWSLRLEDAGTESFVRLLIEALEQERAARNKLLPPWLGRLIGGRQDRDAERQIRELFPVVGAWTLAPGEGSTDDEMLFSISPTGIGNRLTLADWILGFAAAWSNENIVEEYGGEDIFRMPAGSRRYQTFFIRDNTVFLTSDLRAAEAAVDRLRNDNPASRRATPFDRLFDRTAKDRTLRGAVANDRGEVARLWSSIGDGSGLDLLAELRGVTLEGGLEEDGALSISLGLLAPDSRWAATHAEHLETIVREGLAWIELELQVTSAREGDVVRVDLRFVDLVDALGRLLGRHEARTGIRVEL